MLIMVNHMLDDQKYDAGEQWLGVGKVADYWLRMTVSSNEAQNSLWDLMGCQWLVIVSDGSVIRANGMVLIPSLVDHY